MEHLGNARRLSPILHGTKPAASGLWIPLILMTLGMAAPAAGLTTSDRLAVISDQLGYYPCMDCHGDQATYTQPRILEEEHVEPLLYTDTEGVVHQVTFGERLAISQLIAEPKAWDLRSEMLAKVGLSIGIREYMEFNGLSEEDSVWVLTHGGGNIWCLNCHDIEDRNKLVKLNGEKLTFNQSQLLCGECHGPALHDWELGIHGKTTGYWNLAMDSGDVSIRKLCVECHNPHAPAFASMQALPPPVSRIPRRGVDAPETAAEDRENGGHGHE
ncbi:hypothetical protein COW53_07535 [bacterium CG17_big_fil_post_rev_8_21_14_2_50_64_8]|nr:MAG: hypothetical protein COW53_07535 [bacterium CG17_big_fil_post_rev_8_21_14_2_50_64_8]PJA77075.1 MAG: hypothetical protein CO151_00570 [bacterium CG_4_9_14_3_um_filter_65_15]